MSEPLRLYGIPNCDTVQRARTWLAEHGLEVVFHDFKRQGVPAADLQQWIATLGWEPLLNRRGTTWRRLDAATQAGVVDAASAAQLLTAQPSLIRRPVLRWPDGAFSVGFDPVDWAARALR